MSALHIFDMDGTLLRDSTAPMEISRRLGCLEPLGELELRFAAGELSSAQFALQMRTLWHELTPEIAEAVALDAPWIDADLILTPADKVRLTELERTALGLARSACVAYGDSVSDVPLFAALQNTVAVNASDALEASAAVAYRGDDLREAYARGRTLLGAGAR